MEGDSWTAYLDSWEKSNLKLWLQLDSITDLTTFLSMMATIACGSMLFLRRLGVGFVRTNDSFTQTAEQVFIPALLILALSITVNRVASSRWRRIEKRGRTRQKEHDDVVVAARDAVRLARLVQPVRYAVAHHPR